MTWKHVPEALMERFVGGELETLDAVRVATHVDACPACAARAAAAEPMGQVLASMDDPQLPPDLAAGIVEQALARGVRTGRRPEPAVAAGLLVAAAVLVVGLGAPGELSNSLGVLVDTLATVSRSVEAPVALVAPIWAAAAMFTFAAAAMTARRLEVGGQAWR